MFGVIHPVVFWPVVICGTIPKLHPCIKGSSTTLDIRWSINAIVLYPNTISCAEYNKNPDLYPWGVESKPSPEVRTEV